MGKPSHPRFSGGGETLLMLGIPRYAKIYEYTFIEQPLYDDFSEEGG
jgi:hypothetical protein